MPEPLQVPESNDLSKSLCASLNSVWNRYADTAPSDGFVELDTGVVRWCYPEASTADLQEGIASRADGDGPRRTMASFERETADVVAKAMHRKITARFSKKVKDSVATQVFVLETIPRKN
ncbi:MAG: hypothetical protein QOI31_2554 [Solirubrobacterales bacterium]|nr:hypothetical protein [Solirubrobacterales bacterium]